MRFLRCFQNYLTLTVLKVWVAVPTKWSVLQLTKNDHGIEYWIPKQFSNCILRIHKVTAFRFFRQLQPICSHSIDALSKVNVTNWGLCLAFLQALSSSVVWSQSCDVTGKICSKLNSFSRSP